MRGRRLERPPRRGGSPPAAGSRQRFVVRCGLELLEEAVGVARIVLGQLDARALRSCRRRRTCGSVDRLELRGEGHQHVVGRVVDRDSTVKLVDRVAVAVIGHLSICPQSGEPPHRVRLPTRPGALRTALQRTSRHRPDGATAYNPGRWRSISTTPRRRRSGREALDAMLPFLTDHFGNPSSAHAFGRAGPRRARRGP